MKLASFFSHFPVFHPDADEQQSPARKSAITARKQEPVLVFRGLPYKKDQAVVERSVQPPHRVFRGIAYSRALVLSGLEIPESKGAVRIFRGQVVRQD